ncbi:hypothetical protein D6764_05135 [Candidatus Woesearchaeota archaeon]|nr:MAG: hypothetical protein D6764_05135 [Candidatus Woesearchaeota archaeon]
MNALILLHAKNLETTIKDMLEVLGYKALETPEYARPENITVQSGGKRFIPQENIDKLVDYYLQTKPDVTIMDVNYAFPGSDSPEHLELALSLYSRAKENGKKFYALTGNPSAFRTASEKGIPLAPLNNPVPYLISELSR